MWIVVLLRMIMWCKYMTCLRIFSVQSYCLNSFFYVNKCQCCNKCSLMMICDKFQINRTQYAGVISENEKCSSLWKINVAMLDDVTKLYPRIHGKIASKRSRIWDSQYVQKSAEHTLKKHPHNIHARCIWTGSDRKHTIKTGLRGPRPRRMTSGQGKTR